MLRFNNDAFLLVPITDTWRSELRELCAKAGLIAEEPMIVPKAASAPPTPVPRKTVYSGTKKLNS